MAGNQLTYRHVSVRAEGTHKAGRVVDSGFILTEVELIVGVAVCAVGGRWGVWARHNTAAELVRVGVHILVRFPEGAGSVTAMRVAWGVVSEPA